MPDPLRQTISATEAAALFEVSPYVTPWMLYQRFAGGADVDPLDVHVRMDWGKRLEPLILQYAAEQYGLEIRPNIGPDGQQVYVRNGLLGCTRDAEVWCPSRGFGVVEVKCVFDYRIWMQDWDGGNRPPKHHEIQVQQQMLVGAGGTVGGRVDRSKSYKWGKEIVWVAGDVIPFDREPIPKFWDALEDQAAQFFDDVKNGREPEPFGEPREHPLLAEVFPLDEKAILDLRDDTKLGVELAELARMYEWHRQQRLGNSRSEDSIKFTFRKTAKTNGKILLPHGIIANVKDNKTGIGLKVHVPDDLQDGGDLSDFEGNGFGG